MDSHDVAPVIVSAPPECEGASAFEARVRGMRGSAGDARGENGGSLRVEAKAGSYVGYGVLPRSHVERVLYGETCSEILDAFAVVFQLDLDGLLDVRAPAAPPPARVAPGPVPPTPRAALRVRGELFLYLGADLSRQPRVTPALAATWRTSASVGIHRFAWGASLSGSFPSSEAATGYPATVQFHSAQAGIDLCPWGIGFPGKARAEISACGRVGAAHMWARAEGAGATADDTNNRTTLELGAGIHGFLHPTGSRWGVSVRAQGSSPLQRYRYTFLNGAAPVFESRALQAELFLGIGYELF